MPISISSRKWMNCFVHLLCVSVAINAAEPSEGNIVATVEGTPSQQPQAAYPRDTDIVKQLNGTGAIILPMPMEPQWGIPGPEEGYPEREFTKSWHHLASTKIVPIGSTPAGMLPVPNPSQPNGIRVLVTQPNYAIPTTLSSNSSTPDLFVRVGSIAASRPDFDLNSSGSSNPQLSMKNGEGEATATIVLQEAQNLTNSSEGNRVNDGSAQVRQIVFGTGIAVGQQKGQPGSQLITSSNRGPDTSMKSQILEAPPAIEHVIYLGGEKKKVEPEIPTAKDPNVVLPAPPNAGNTVVIRQELRIPQEEGLANETRGPDEKEESAPVNIVNVIRADGQTLNLQLPNISAQDAVSDETANNIITQLIGQGYGQWFGKPSNYHASASIPASIAQPSEIISHETERKPSPWHGIIPIGAGWPQPTSENPVKLVGQKPTIRVPFNVGITKPDNNAGPGSREINLSTEQPKFGVWQGNPKDSNNAIDRVGFKLKGKQDNIFSPISIPQQASEPNDRASILPNATMKTPNSSQAPQAELPKSQPKSPLYQLGDGVPRNINLQKPRPGLKIKIPSGVVSVGPVDTKDRPVIDNASGTKIPPNQARPVESQATLGTSDDPQVINPTAKLGLKVPGIPSQREPQPQPAIFGSGRPSTGNPPISATMPQPNNPSSSPPSGQDPTTSNKLPDYLLGQNPSVRPGGEALLIYRLWRPKESKWFPTTEGVQLLPGISDENRLPSSSGTQTSPQDSGAIAKPNKYWAWWVQKPKQPLPKYIPSRTDIQKPSEVPVSPGGQWLVFPPSNTNSANSINSSGTSTESNNGIPSGTWAWMVGENAPGTAGQQTPQTNKGEPSRRGRWLWIGSSEGAATTPLPDRPISFPAPPQPSQEPGRPHTEWRGPLWLPYFRRMSGQNDVVSAKPQEPEWVGPLWLPWPNATPTIPNDKQPQPGSGEKPEIISPAPGPAPTIPWTPPIEQLGLTFESTSPVIRGSITNIPSSRPGLPTNTTCDSLAARDAEIRAIPMKSYRTSSVWRQADAAKWQATPGDVSIYPGAAVSIRLAGPSSIVDQNEPEISDQLARLIDNKSDSRTGSWVIIHPADIERSEEEQQLAKTCLNIASGASNSTEQPRGFWAYLNSPETFGQPGMPSTGAWKWIGRLPPNSPVPTKVLPNVPSDVQNGPIDKQAPDIPQAYEPLISASPRQLDVDATGRIVDSPPLANPKEAGPRRPWLGPLWLPFKNMQPGVQRQVDSIDASKPAVPVSELSWIGPFWFPRSDTPENHSPKQPTTSGHSNGNTPSRGQTDKARPADSSPGINGDNTNNPTQVPTDNSAKPTPIQATIPSRPNNGSLKENSNNTAGSKRPGTANQTQLPSVNENEPSTLPNAEIGSTTKLPGTPGNNPTPPKIVILPQILGTPDPLNRPLQGIPDQTRPTITSPGTGVDTSSNPQQANGDSVKLKKPSKTPTHRPGEGRTAQHGSEFPQTLGGLTQPETIPPVQPSREIIPGTVQQRPSSAQQVGKGSVVPPRQSGRKPTNKVPNGKLQELTNATSQPNRPVQKLGDTVIQKPDEIPKLKNGQNEPPSGQPNKSAEDSSPQKPATPVVSAQGTPGPGTKPPGATDTKPAGQVGNTVQPTIKQPPAAAVTATPNTSGSTPLSEARFKVWRPSTGTWVDADQMTFDLPANVGSNAPNNPNGTTPNGNRPGRWIFLINGPETQTPAIASNGTQSNLNGRWIFLELPSSQSLNNTGSQRLDRDTKNPQAEQAPSTSKGFWVWLGGDKNKQPEDAQQKFNSSPTSSQPNKWLWIGDSKDAGQRPNYAPQLDPRANRKGLASIPKPTPQTAMSSEEPRRTIHLVAPEACSSGKRQKRSVQPADAPIINVNCYWFGPAYLAVGQEGRTDNPSDEAPAPQASSSQSPNYVGPMWIPVPKEATEGLPSGSGTFYPPGHYAANKPGQIYEIANPDNGIPNVVYKLWNPTTDSWQTVDEGVPVSTLQRWNPQRTFADGNVNQPNNLRKENLPEHQWAWLAPKKQNPGQSPAAAPQSSGDKGTWVILNPWISNSTDHSPIKPESINNFRPMPFWAWLPNETTPELGPNGSGGKWVWIGPKDGAGKPPSQTPDASKFTAPTELFRPDQSTESQQVPHPFKVVFTRPTREIDEALSAIPQERVLPDANNPDWLGPIWIPKSADKAKPFEPGKEGQHPDWLGPLWLPQPKGHDVAHPDSQYGLNDPDLSNKPLPNNPTALPKDNIANPQPNAPTPAGTVSPQENLPNAPGQGQIAPIIPGLPKPGEVISPSPSLNLPNGAPTPLPSAALQRPQTVPRTTSTNGATPSNVAELPNGQQSPSAKPQRTIVLPVKTIQMVPSALTPSHPQLQKPNAQNPTQPDPSTNPANQGGAPGTPNPFQQAGPPASLQPPNMPRRENDRSNPMANSPIQTTSPSYPLPSNVGNPAMIPFPSSNPNQAQSTTTGASIVLPAGPSSPSPPGASEPRNPIGMPFDNKPLLPSGSSTPGELKPVVQPLMGGNPFTGNLPVLPGSAPQSPIKPTTIYFKQPALPGGSDGIPTSLPPPSLPNSTSASITSPLPEVKPSPFSLLGPPNPAGPVLPASPPPSMGPSSLVPESKSLVGMLPQTSHVNPQQGTILPSPGNQPGNSNSITDRPPLGTAMPLPSAFPGEATPVHTLGAQIPGSSTNTPIILPSGNQHLPAGQAGIPGMLHASGLVPVVPPRLPDNHGSFKPGPTPEPVPYTPNHPNEPAQPNTVTPSPPFGQTTGNVLPEELKALHPFGVAPHGWLIPPKPHFPNSVASSPELVPKPYGQSLPKPDLQPVIQPQSMPHLRKPYQPRQPIPAMPAFPLKPIYPIVRQPPKPELRPLAPQVRYPSPVPPELKPIRPVVRPSPKAPGPRPSNSPLKPELRPIVRPPGPPVRPIVPSPAISPLNVMPVRKPLTFEQKPIIPAAMPLRPNINRLQLLKPANSNPPPPRELQPIPAKPLPIAPHDASPMNPLRLQPPAAPSKPIVILPQTTLIQPKFNPPMKHREEEPTNPAEFGLAPKGHPHPHPQIAVRPVTPSLTPNPMAMIEPHPQALPHGNPLAIPNPHDVPLLNQPVHHLPEPLIQPIAHQHQDPHVNENDPHLHPHLLLPSKNMPYHHDHGSTKPQAVPAPAAA